MVRKKLFSILRGTVFLGCMLLLTQFVKAQFQPDVKWGQTYNNLTGSIPTPAQDWILGMTTTSDGGSLAVGFTWAGSDATGHCYDPAITSCYQGRARSPFVAKISSTGTVTNYYQYYNSTGDIPGCGQGDFWGVVEASDGYVVAGYDASSNLIVLKLDKTNLNATPLATFTKSNGYRAYNMKKVYTITSGSPVPDGYIITGYYEDPSTHWKSTYILKLKNDLTFDWEKTITKVHYCRALSVAPLYQFGTNWDGTPTQAPGGGYGSGNIVEGFVVGGYIENGSISYAMAINVDNTSSHNIVWTSMINSLTGNFLGTSLAGNYNYSLDDGSTWPGGTTYGRFAAKQLNVANTIYDVYGNDLSNLYAYLSSNSAVNPTTLGNSGRSIIQTSTHDIVMACELHDFEIPCNNSSFDDEYHDGDIVLAKWTGSTALTTGSVSTVKEIAHGSGGDYWLKVKETSDGGFLALASSSDKDVLADLNDKTEMVLYKTDVSFNPEWTKPIPSSVISDISGCAFDFDFTADGGFIVGGNNGQNNDDLAYIKLLNCEAGLTSTYNIQTILANSFGGTPIVKDGAATSGPTYDAAYHGLSTPAIISGTWVVNGDVTLSNYTFYFLDTKLTSNYLSGSPSPSGVVINSGGHLTLNNCTFRGIDGSTLSSPCTATINYMWDGITLLGNISQPQTNLTTTGQGKLELYGSIIRDARTGVAVGTLGGGNGGGILIAGDNGANHTKFLDNEYGVSFIPYTDGTNPNLSGFTNCVFDCDKPLKDYNGAGVNIHLYLYGINKLTTFSGNTFDNTYAVYPNPGYGRFGQGKGIYAYGTSMDINNPVVLGLSAICPTSSVMANTNHFNNLDFGISIDGFGAYTNPESVWLCSFQNDKQGITVNGNQSNVSIGLNYFYYSNVLPDLGRAVFSSTPCAANNWSGYTGIRITGCPQYTITNNRLSITPTVTTNFYSITGIWATNSGNTSTTSGIFYNEFRNQSALAATASPSLSYGVWSTGIRIDATIDAMAAKKIDLWGNGRDNANPTNPNPNLHNFCDLFIDDPEFKQTPSTGGQGTDNFFTLFPGDPALSKQIINNLTTFTFAYNYKNTLSGQEVPTNNSLHVSPNPFSGLFSPIPTNFCMNTTNVMPAGPLQHRDEADGGTIYGNSQTVFANPVYADITAMALEIIPNPFQGSADIRYTIPVAFGPAIFDIFDGLGHKVQTMNLSPENHDLTLYGSSLKPGIYYYTATANGSQKLSGKFVVANP